MSSRFCFPILSIVFVFAARTAFSQIIWQENFSGANQGWTQNFADCDAPGFAGVQNGRFEVTDMEGNCCAVGGDNDNEWVTNDISTTGYCSVSISVDYSSIGIFECQPGGPYFACTNNPAIDNGHDQMVFEYALNGSGSWVQFDYLCGGVPGSPPPTLTATATGLICTSIQIRIRPANKAQAETYWFDNVTVSGVTLPTVNPVNDVTVCAGQSVSVTFSGTGNPPPTFSWTNDNTAIGLGASGNGNINFITPAGLSSQQVANIAVTPVSAGCFGIPETFTITVNPLPTVDDPPNITVCPGDALNIIFTGSDPNATYNWTASLPIPGAGASGMGNINIPVIPFIPFPISANVTVTATANGCTGSPQTFTVSGFPTPSGNMTLTGSSNICQGQNATFSVSISNGSAPFSFIYAIDGVNQAPVNANASPFTFNLPMNSGGTFAVNLVSVTASNTCEGAGTGSANINVTPTPTAAITPGISTICTGEDVDIEINFTGNAPFTFIYKINNVNQAPITTAGPIYTLNISPASPGTYTYTLASVTSNGCTGTVSGAYTLTVNQTPTASLSGGATVCAGQTTPLTVTFTGMGPFTFTYAANGDPQPPITTSNNPYTFFVAPGFTTTYDLVDVTAKGCSGTVQGVAIINVSPSPTATLASGDTTICTGQSANLSINFTGPGPYTFIYAVNNVAQPPIVTPLTTYSLTVSPVSGVNTYTLVSVSGGGCPGIVSGTYIVTVGTPPTAVLSGDTTICPNDTAYLLIKFTGTPPFIFEYTANGLLQQPDTATVDSFIFKVTPLSATAYVLTSVRSNGCTGTVSGQATVNIAPGVSAVISGGGQICTGGSGIDITVNFFGPGPYTFSYSANSDTMSPITTSTNPYIFNVNPNIGTVYKLVSVNNGMCDGPVSGMATVFVFTPPTAVISGNQIFCNSANTTVTVDFTGTGPFTIIYTIDGIAQPPDTTMDDPYFIPVNTTTTTVYELISVVSPGCVGIPSGTATITINYAPSYANLNLNCNIAAGNYVVTFDVLGATLPLTLVSGSGSFSGAQFTSNPILLGQPYSFVFHDANNCGNVTVAGASTCNCVTDAGTMNLTPIEACVGDTVTATHNNNFVNDGNDILRFILHTNAALPIGTIIAWNTTPLFTFTAGMTPGVTYYISAIAGNNDGTGLVNLNDPCLSVSQGTPVIFYALPTADLGMGDSICAGQQAIISVTLTGVAPFSLTWSLNGGAPQTATNIPTSTYQLTIQPIVNTTVTLISVSDSRCTAQVTDTAVIAVTPIPQISNISTVCDLATFTYTLSFNVSGTPPFNIIGTTGTFNGNQFTSVPIPSGSPYNVTVSDAGNCGQASISDTVVCNCISNAGTMSQTPVTVCESDILNVPPVSGQTLDNNDILLYIFHTTPGDPPGTILAWNNIPQFAFQPGIQTNITYYISAIVGNPDGNGQINLNDPCLSIALGTPVQFHALPVADLGILDTAVCQNQPVTLTVNFTGAAPFSLSYSYSGIPQPTVTGINNNPYIFTINPTQNIVVQLDSVSDQYCSTGGLLGTAIINVAGIPTAANLQTLCDSVTQTYVVQFDIQGGTQPFIVTGLAGTVTGSQFVSNPIPSGTPFNGFLSDLKNCRQDTLSGNIVCNCTSNAGTLNQTALLFCPNEMATIPPATGTVLDGNDALVYVLATAPAPPAWTILATNGTPSFNFNAGTMSYNTPYYIVALVGNALGGGVDLNDPCLSVATGPTVTWRMPVTATLSGSTTICEDTPASLLIQFTGDGPYIFTYTENGIPKSDTTTLNPYPLAVAPASTTPYNLVSVTGLGNCSGTVSGSAIVTVNPTPQALNVQVLCDFATQTYILYFDVSNGAAPNSTYTITGVSGAFADTTFLSFPIPATQTSYSVTITDAIGCSSSFAGEADCTCDNDAGTLSPSILNVCLPDKAVVQANGDQVLEAGDLLQFILYQDSTLLPGSIIATNDSPQFDFLAGMTTGTTYYISVIVGNDTGAGTVDWNDPCLSVSPGIPVVFHDPPTATLTSDSVAFCVGGNASFQIQFIGTPPFKFVYAINGNPQPQITAPGNTFSITTNNVQQSQVFTLISVEDAFCPGTVSGQAKVKIIPGPTGSLIGDATICEGGTATLTLALTGGTSYDVTIGGGATPIVLTGVQNGATVNVTPAATTTYIITALTAAGNICLVNIGAGATVTVSELGATGIISDYNGFGVSCPNANDGFIEVTVSGGIPPILANWDNGATGLLLDNLDAGVYVLTLTDQAGCVFLDTFELTAPPELLVAFETESPVCFGENTGVLTVTDVQGGAGPYTLSINDLPFVTTDTFPASIGQLAAGDYLLEIADANGCITDEAVTILSPPQLTVDLGPDQTLNFGDSTLLEAIVNTTAIDVFAWSPITFLSAPDSLISFVKPPQTLTYSITVFDTSGCSARDEVLMTVRKTKRVYLSNIIKPESNEFNDVFFVQAGPEVRNVRTMRVFDRWGELVFENQNFAPNDPQFGWRGNHGGDQVNPGVYVYVVEVEFFDGTTDVLSGDVTVIR